VGAPEDESPELGVERTVSFIDSEYTFITIDVATHKREKKRDDKTKARKKKKGERSVAARRARRGRRCKRFTCRKCIKVWLLSGVAATVGGAPKPHNRRTCHG
jgi:hypothetical protein